MLPLVKAITVDLIELSNEVIDRRERLAMLTGGRDIDGQDPYSQELAQVQEELERDVERLRHNPFDVDAGWDFFVTAEHIGEWTDPESPYRHSTRHRETGLL